MSSRYPSPAGVSFGPGPMTQAVQIIVIANIAVFVAMMAAGPLIVEWFGLSPEQVLTRGRVWQLATYLFLHGDVFHILFNLLAVWMFGVDLERRWGTQAFVKYYAVTGIGAGICTLLVALLPFGRETYLAATIGASGAVYGLLMAWAIIFPHRTILFLGVFPLTARVFVLIMGAISFSQALNQGGGTTVAHVAHLGGLLAGYWYLKTPVRKSRPKPRPPNPANLHRVH
jgi:membrane associated rhomboid family serine protease